MARIARFVFPGYPHHVLQRGNYDQPVFSDDADYRIYLGWLHDYASRYSVEIWAYCLMPNHVHFICVPKFDDGLARTFNTLHMRYAQYFNGRSSIRGHLWRARFMSCAMDMISAREDVRFIESNPVRSGIVAKAEEYSWSSARSHVLGLSNPLLSEVPELKGKISDWRAFLAEPCTGVIISKTRERLRTGRPTGSRDFVMELEALAGRRLEALPRGRPRKSAPILNGA